MQIENPRVDYTPPSYITLLFTDLGEDSLVALP